MSLDILYLIAKLGHFIGIATGVGGAIASDLLFMRSIKNKTISKDEIALLTTLSSLLWAGLLTFLVSGLLFMYVQQLQLGYIKYFEYEPFKAKLTLFLILSINAIAFHKYVFPKLAQAGTQVLYKAKVEGHALLISIVGSISIVTWVSIFLLGTFRKITPHYFSFEGVLFLHAILVLCGTIVGYRLLAKK